MRKVIFLVTVILIGLGGIFFIRIVNINRETKELKQHLAKLVQPSISPTREAETLLLFKKKIEEKSLLSDYEIIFKKNPFSFRTLATQEDLGPAEPSALIYRGKIKIGDKLNFIIEDRTKKEIFFLDLKAEIQGYRIKHVTEDSIILEKGEEILVLKRQQTEASKE